MNKKTIICVAVIILVLVAVCLIFILGRGAEKPKDAAAETEGSASEKKTGEDTIAAPGDVKDNPSPAEADKTNETETESAQLIEEGGNITIIIPEDEESDGF